MSRVRRLQLKFLPQNLLLLARMKEIILPAFVNQHHIYVPEELEQSLVNLLSMTWTLRMSSGLQEFNKDKKMLMPEKFENLLFKLEVLDHKARERAGIITPTLGSPIPVLLQIEAAIEALQSQPIKFAVLESVYWYWKEKVFYPNLLHGPGYGNRNGFMPSSKLCYISCRR